MNKLLSLFLVFLIPKKVLTQFSLCDFTVPHPGISVGCLSQLETVCTNTTLFWQLFDSSSKYPYTGISYSNNRDIGNYDECLAIDHDTGNERILGKFCPLSLIVINFFLFTIMKSPQVLSVYELGKLNQSVRVNGISSDFNTEHYFSVLSLCMPDACEPQEIIDFFDLNATGIVMLTAMPCTTVETDREFDTKDIVVGLILILIFLIIVISTTYECILRKQRKEPKHELLLAFSLIKNGKMLFETKKLVGDQIGCVNGLRTISMAWIIAGHAYTLLLIFPLTNAQFTSDYLHSWKGQFIRSSTIAVDTFFFLSGMLWAYIYIKKSIGNDIKKQINKIPFYYIHRYLRLTPALAILYLFVISLLRRIGFGPLNFGTDEIENCEQKWWKFFLYIQNYDDNMCIIATWYLSADMQMFLLSPLILVPVAFFIGKHPKKVMSSLILITIISFIVPLSLNLANENVESTYHTHTRFSSYLVGVITGIILRQTNDKPFFFSRHTNVLIWMLVFGTSFGMNTWYHFVLEGSSNVSNSFYTALYMPIWAASLGWIVYSCHKGYGGIINWILSQKIFQIGSKVSYSMYLLHIIVLGHWMGMHRNAITYTPYLEFYRYCAHFTITLLYAILWVLAFEMPMLTVDKFLFRSKKIVKKTTE